MPPTSNARSTSPLTLHSQNQSQCSMPPSKRLTTMTNTSPSSHSSSQVAVLEALGQSNKGNHFEGFPHSFSSASYERFPYRSTIPLQYLFPTSVIDHISLSAFEATVVLDNYLRNLDPIYSSIFILHTLSNDISLYRA